MFFISSLHLALNVIQFYVQPSYGCDPIPPGYATNLLNAAKAGVSCLERVQYIISDGIVVWRAIVIWPRNRWVLGGLVFCMLATASKLIAFLLFTCFLVRDY